MRRSRVRAAIVAISAAAALVACGSGSDTGPTQAPQAPQTTSTGPGPQAAGVSPGGVTTSVAAPAESTEDEYFQACRAATEWMAQQGGDPKTQVEPFLAQLQSTDAPGPATFDTPWSQLSADRQAAVIVAVQAGADALCG